MNIYGHHLVQLSCTSSYTFFLLLCRLGLRANLAAAELENMGYRNVRIYLGSLNDWLARQGPLVKWQDPQEEVEQ